MNNEDAIWQADVYDTFTIEYEFNGIKKIIRAWAGKWNGWYDYTGDSPELLQEKAAVRAALAAEIERRKAEGQKPDYSDREP